MVQENRGIEDREKQSFAKKKSEFDVTFLLPLESLGVYDLKYLPYVSKLFYCHYP